MSGGRFNYDQYRIGDIACTIQEFINSNDDETTNEWGDTIGRGYPAEVIERFREAVTYLRLAELYAHRIDWLLSGDDAEDSFLRRLDDELQGLNP